VKSLPPGATSCSTRETRIHRLHLIVYGQVKLAFTSPQGGEKVVDIVGQGQTFGEAVMFMDKPFMVYAQALADSLLLHISKTAILDELDKRPQDWAAR
jgi:CRP-like cAMP-binding protein